MLFRSLARPAEVQGCPAAREVVSGAGVDPGRALVQAAALALAPVVAQGFPADREVVPVVRVSALPAALREDRPEEVVQRAAAAIPQLVQALVRAMVDRAAARVVDPVAGQVAGLAAGRAVVALEMVQATAVPGSAVMANAV